MDWVHCNSCYVQPNDVEGKKYSITNCGHIYCGECLQLPALKECVLCHVKYNTLPLNPKMSPDVEMYFLSPTVQIQKAIKVFEFQQNHRNSLIKYLRDRLMQYKTLKKEVYSLKEEINRLKEELQIMQDQDKRRKEEIHHYKKKFELLAKQIAAKRMQQQQSPNSSFTPKEQLRTPASGMRISSGKSTFSQDSGSQESQNSILRRPSGTSDFFMMSGQMKSPSQGSLFSTPVPPRFPGTYRSQTFTPTPTTDFSSPATPGSSQSITSLKDPLQRKMKLPGDKGGPSPASKLALHRLHLSRPTSTPNKEVSVTSKYVKYF